MKRETKEKLHDISTDVSAYSAYWVVGTIVGSIGSILMSACVKNKVLAGIGCAASIIGGLALGDVAEKAVRENSECLLANQLIDILPEEK